MVLGIMDQAIFIFVKKNEEKKTISKLFIVLDHDVENI